MQVKQFTAALFIIFGAFLFSPVSSAQSKADKERSQITQQGIESLDALYAQQPSSRKAIEKAAGYAVFNQFGMKILVAGGGSGKGYAFNNKSKKKTYMKMAEVQAGLGFGIKKFTLVWVFENEKALNNFINSGWELGAQSNFTAVSEGEGLALEGAISVSPGVWIYQMTQDGLSLELTVKGTKYYKDGDLN
jgi:lipid-binding SYLF domain-containing protein